MIRMMLFGFIILFDFVYASTGSLINNLQYLEKETKGHIGLSVIDLNNDQHLSYHGDELFPMGCTSKVIGVAAILKQSMTNNKLLDERIYYKKSDLTNWTPVTQQHLSSGMTIDQLNQAAIEYSDNTAMNLLVVKAGGLNQINQFANNDLHNKSFRQDRNWPNEALAVPGGKLDNSTPNDMANSLNELLFGNVLGQEQKAKLQTWMKMCKTGDKRIRSGIPKGWEVADKTGTGYFYAVTNDIAVVWPPKCKPIILAVYYYRQDKKASKKEDMLGKVANIALHELAKNDACLKNQLH